MEIEKGREKGEGEEGSMGWETHKLISLLVYGKTR